MAEIIDLPGLYELGLDVPETRIARDVLSGAGLYRQPDAVLVVIDACNLTRNLVLVGELLAYGLPVVVALNMIDLAQGRGLTIDGQKLSDRLGCPVVPMVARRGDGVDEVRSALARALDARAVVRQPTAAGVPGEGASIEALTNWADDVMAYSAGRPSAPHARDAFTERLDRTSSRIPSLGLVVFVLVMGGLFYTLFALATIPMDLIEATFARLGDFAARLLPEGPVRALVSQGIIGGVAGTVVFLPQICLLFFLISLLEDTGYLARAAFVMDRVLRRFGLPGSCLRAAADLVGVRPARHHVHAADPGPPRSAGDDPRRAADELLGATAGLRPAHESAVSAASALRRGGVRGVLPARCAGRARHGHR